MNATLHPGTILLAWAAFVLFVQSLSLVGISLAAAIVLSLAAALTPARMHVLIRRARWLLLSVFILFMLGTPGERLAGAIGDLGITRDGLILGAEHLVRLVLLLATLALVHQRLGTEGVMAGLYWILAPLAGRRGLRERIVVRLMLVVEYVETPGRRDWRSWLSDSDQSGPEERRDGLRLLVRPARSLDWLILLLLAVVAAGGWWRR